MCEIYSIHLSLAEVVRKFKDYQIYEGQAHSADCDLLCNAISEQSPKRVKLDSSKKYRLRTLPKKFVEPVDKSPSKIVIMSLGAHKNTVNREALNRLVEFIREIYPDVQIRFELSSKNTNGGDLLIVVEFEGEDLCENAVCYLDDFRTKRTFRKTKYIKIFDAKTVELHNPSALKFKYHYKYQEFLPGYPNWDEFGKYLTGPDL